jgi:hypothetical protein
MSNPTISSSSDHKRARTQDSEDQQSIAQSDDALYHEMPTSCKRISNEHAKQMAAIACKIRNLQIAQKQITEDLENGIIPKPLQHKFKKMFLEEEYTDIRTMAIRKSSEILQAELTTQLLEQQNIYDNRYTTVRLKLQPILTFCTWTLNEDFNTNFQGQIDNIKGIFLAKQLDNEDKKLQKQTHHAEDKETNELAATITNKDVKAANHSIRQLQNQVKSLTITLAQIKGKGQGSSTRPVGGPKHKKKQSTPASRNSTTTPKIKPTGTAKNRNGNKQDSTKNKKSRGRTGRQ